MRAPHSAELGPAGAFSSRAARPLDSVGVLPLPVLGKTPLVPLPFPELSEGAGTSRIWGKAEYLNPTGSVKDRAADAIVRAALRDGELGDGRTLLDASSGNTGVAYAYLGSRYGFAVELCLPANARPDRVERARSWGAKVVLTDPSEGSEGAQKEARRRADAFPELYFYADQYSNRANAEAHYRSTGPEIWEAVGSSLTHFVAGVGTGGTITGVGRFLKEKNAAIRVVGVQPTGPLHGLEGLKHLPTAQVPAVYDPAVVDETLRVESETAQRFRLRLDKEFAVRVGASAAAAVAASVEVGQRSPGASIVTILPDAGEAERPEEP